MRSVQSILGMVVIMLFLTCAFVTAFWAIDRPRAHEGLLYTWRDMQHLTFDRNEERTSTALESERHSSSSDAVFKNAFLVLNERLLVDALEQSEHVFLPRPRVTLCSAI